MDTFIPKPTEDTAEFNNAFAFLERLNKIEYMIEISLMEWKLSETFSALESYENELCFCFKGDNQGDVDKIKETIITLLNEGVGQIKRSPMNNKKFMVGKEKMGDLRCSLIELNKKLRYIKFKRGMGMPIRGDSKLF